MSIKLIVTDLDGTFLNSNHITIPQENIDAFKKAHQMGIKTALASGRTKILADYIIEQLPFIDYLITSNGAVSYDLQEKRVFSSILMSNADSLKIFDVLKDFSLPFEIYFKGDCFMNSQSYSLFDEEHIPPHIYKLLKDFIKEVPTLEGFIDGKGIEKLNILSLSAKDRVEIEKKIGEKCSVAFTSSFPIYEGMCSNLEMTHENATKAFAIRAISEKLGINPSEIMCFGDSENDCPMLEFAEYSFAMANGNDLAKATAKYVTDTNDNAGVAKAINEYVFGE